jgi:hypothetical protein
MGRAGAVRALVGDGGCARLGVDCGGEGFVVMMGRGVVGKEDRGAARVAGGAGGRSSSRARKHGRIALIGSVGAGLEAAGRDRRCCEEHPWTVCQEGPEKGF